MSLGEAVGLVGQKDYEGPLTMSIRLDTSQERRDFYIKRITELSIGNDYKKDLFESLWEEMERMEDIKGDDKYAGYSHIRQSHGDLVMFANNPHPSLHAVENRISHRRQGAGRGRLSPPI